MCKTSRVSLARRKFRDKYWNDSLRDFKKQNRGAKALLVAPLDRDVRALEGCT